jgi:hypothetical protein
MGELTVRMTENLVETLLDDPTGIVQQLRRAYEALSNADRRRIDELFGEIPSGDRRDALAELMRYFFNLVSNQIAPEPSLALAKRMFDAVGSDHIRVITRAQVPDFPYGVAVLFAFMLTINH